jgi:uncharacterized protein (TIGR02246 family)
MLRPILYSAAAVGVFVAAIFATAPKISIATVDTCKPVSKPEIAGLLIRWNLALATKDAKRVAANYTPDALFQAVDEAVPRRTPEEITAYYAEQLKFEPQVAMERQGIEVGCNVAADRGEFSINLKNADGSMTKIPARYSFDYKVHRGDWKIYEHRLTLRSAVSQR